MLLIIIFHFLFIPFAGGNPFRCDVIKDRATEAKRFGAAATAMNGVLACVLLLSALLLGSGFLHQQIHTKYVAATTIHATDKDEQYKIQQEMLAKRKNKTKMTEYFEKVEAKRKEVSKAMKETSYTGISDKEDPIVVWQKRKENGLLPPLGYEADKEKGSFVFPASPIDIPKYDNGQRFDLRLPYAERGYVDVEEEEKKRKFTENIGNFLGNIFGSKKSKK